jgi:hypothetical protein
VSRLCAFVLFASVIVLSGGLVGQEPKKGAPQQGKKDDPPAKVKGMLPNGWRKLGLSATQVQEVYKIQAKYNAEIDKLEEKIAELKATMAKERLAVLTPDQKKQLAGETTGKDK